MSRIFSGHLALIGLALLAATSPAAAIATTRAAACHRDHAENHPNADNKTDGPAETGPAQKDRRGARTFEK
jgi:hypothetical protein